ncbi:MAG: zinc ribbon domain-containing protein [Clostridia bacterium]|nr:zinc ribbon domain-containing protein [Clostridia bacterium]
MVCKSCGAQLDDGLQFCTNCGAPQMGEPQAQAYTDASAYQQPAQQPTYQYQQPAQQPTYQYQQPTQQPTYQYQQPTTYQQAPYQQPARAEDPAASALAKSLLTFGILATAFTFTFYFSFLSIIFGAIGLGKANTFATSYGPLYGRAKVGRILSLVGLIVGSVFTFICLIIIIALASN